MERFSPVQAHKMKQPRLYYEYNEYIQLKELPNGNLEITLTPEGKEYITDNQDSEEQNLEGMFYDMFESIMCNSSSRYTIDLGTFLYPLECHLTNAPAILTDVCMDDWGSVESYGSMWYYADYQILDFVRELLDRPVIFQRHK
jgi:hypothetical protein